MEILHTNDKRTILTVLNDCEDADVFCEHLSSDFDIVRTNNTEEALGILHERIADLSVVIVDIDMAQENDFHFLHAASADSLFDTIPVLAASRRQLNDDDMCCLKEGVLDFLLPPHHRELTKQRIDNAIRIKSSTTFYEIESMLKELPSNIFLKDAEGRYVFATHYWHHLDQGDDPNWTIRGKTDLEIRKDRENAIKAMEADKEIIRSGKGTTYVIEINTDGIQEFMELIKRPVFDDEGNVTGIIALINDVTEAELFRRELERRARTDELTGLGNHRAFDEFVSELANSDGYPISIISADCDGLKKINDTFGHLVGDEYIRMAATVFRACIPDDATAFRTGGDEFVVFLPHTTQEEAEELVADMHRKSELFWLKQYKISISFGTCMIDGPESNVITALASADRAMYRNKLARKRERHD